MTHSHNNPHRDHAICRARAARWVSKLLIPPQFRGSVWLDLEEEYAATFPRAMPTGPNRYWFRRQILASAPQFMVCRLRTDRTLATWCTLVASTATGLALAYVGGRPTRNITKALAVSILISAGGLALIGSGRPWFLAMVLGSWIPLHNVAIYGGYASLRALAFSFAGDYFGADVRRAIVSSCRSPRTRVPTHDAV